MKNLFHIRYTWSFLLATLMLSLTLHAQVAMDASGSYTQNFDGMGATGTTLPANWSSTRSVVVGTGSSNGGNLYNFGTANASDRALGSLGSGSTGTFYYGVVLRNTTAQAITNIQLRFTGEQWRSAKATTDVLPLHYQVSTSAITIGNTGTWNAVTALNFTSPNLTGSGAVDGNAAANRTVLSATTIVASLPANSYLALRWTQVDNSGSDHGLGIDDLVLTWVATVPPSLTAGTVSDFGPLPLGNASASQSFSLSGAGLTGAPGNITVTAPSTDFQVSNNNSTWAASTTVAYAGATLASTNVWVRFTPQATGVRSGNVSISGGGASASVAVSGTGTNSLTVSVPSLAFGNQNVGSASTAQSFTVSGSGLLPASGPITATAPADFQVSNDNSTWAGTAVLNYTGGALSAVPLYVRFNPGSGGSKSGNVTLAGGSFSGPPSVAVTGTGVVAGAPTLTSSVPSVAFASQIVGTSSASQSFTIAGTDLTGAPGNITVSSSNGDLQVSANNSTWSSSIVVPFTSATLANTAVYVRFTPQAGGVRTGDISITGDGASTISVSFSGTGLQPALSATALEDFGATCVNNTGSTFAFTLSGTNLTAADITVGPLDGFLFFDGSDFQPSLVLPQPGGSFSTDVNVRFVPTAVGSYAGNIPVSGGGASSIAVPVTASGVNTPPEVGAGTASAITLHTATITAAVITEGCSFLSGTGVEFSTTDGFANGTGTQVTGTDLGGGSFSADLSGLAPCTTYYFRAFGSNDGGTAYGPQGTFTATAIGASITTAATGVFSTGFTANWQAVPEATGYLLDVSTQPTFSTSNLAPDLLISEYLEGASGSNKYIEVYNGTGASINLSNYQLRLYSNGASAPSTSTTLTGMLAPGAAAVFRNSAATTYAGGVNNAAVNFNGNDAIVLYKISTATNIDIVGRIGEDPGTAWTATGGRSTADKDLVRKSTVTAGIAVNPASGFPTLATEWDVFTDSDVSHLGTHTSVVPVTDPSFVTGYSALPVSGTSQTVTGLVLGQTYYYRVRAVIGSCMSSNSNTTQVTTACDPVVLDVITTNAPICSLSELELQVSALSGEGPITYQWSGAGTYAPNAQAPQVLVTGTATGTYSVSASNGCSTAQAGVDVQVEQATTWYFDADGDGLGDAAVPQQSCGQPEGYVATPGDGCPDDANKTAPGICGCGTPDTDADNDGVADCLDLCANGPEPGTACDDANACTLNDVISNACVCVGTPAPDADGDGTCDSQDGCPGDPDKIAPGVCGCGVADVTTTWYADADGDGFGDPASGQPGYTCAAPAGYVADNTDDCPGVPGRIGDSCNDNNPFTANDVIGGDCACAGTPVPSHNWSLRIVTDNAGNETTFEVRDVTTNFLLASGGPFPSNSVIEQVVSIPDIGHFTLRVFDSGNNGIAGGGYLLRDQNGDRVIDNLGNGAGFTSVSESPEGFYSPVGTDRLRDIDCDNVERWPFDMIVASTDPLVSAQWQVGNQTDDGYEFWFTDPNGSYSRHIFRSHATSGGYGPADATRACKLGLDSWAVGPLPQGLLLNVRIRGRVNGTDLAWGQACRLKVDQAAANCHTTQLENMPGPNLSCGATGLKTDGGSRIWAKPVTRYIRSTNTYINANKYKWHFVNVGESTSFDLYTPSYPMLIYPQYGFQLGATYEVTVQASFDNGVTYCPVGAQCPISFAATNRRIEEQAAAPGDLQLWPNPNNGGQVHVYLGEVPQGNGEAAVDIVDMFGQRVMGRTVVLRNGQLDTVIDLQGELANGLYLVNVTVGGRTITKRMVVQR